MITVTKVRTPMNQCLRCHVDMDAASCVNDPNAVPKERDLTICMYCAHLMCFDKDLHLRELTAEERAEVESQPLLAKIQQEVTNMKNVHPHRKTLQ